MVWSPLGFIVNSTMLIKISLLSELFLTMRTFIRLLSVVHPHMINEIPALIEFFVAFFILTKEISHCSPRLLIVLIHCRILVTFQSLDTSGFNVVILGRSEGPFIIWVIRAIRVIPLGSLCFLYLLMDHFRRIFWSHFRFLLNLFCHSYVW